MSDIISEMTIKQQGLLFGKKIPFLKRELRAEETHVLEEASIPGNGAGLYVVRLLKVVPPDTLEVTGPKLGDDEKERVLGPKSTVVYDKDDINTANITSDGPILRERYTWEPPESTLPPQARK